MGRRKIGSGGGDVGDGEWSRVAVRAVGTVALVLHREVLEILIPDGNGAVVIGRGSDDDHRGPGAAREVHVPRIRLTGIKGIRGSNRELP